jgi:CheY-like chemotaxis protein
LPPPAPPLTVLVVDDDPDIRRIAALSLERIGGYHVVLASSGAEAVEIAARAPPAAVLLDVTMPGTDGPATLATLLTIPGMRGVPIVFFTATASEAEASRLESLGAAGVVAKPFDFLDLPRRLRAILERAGL